MIPINGLIALLRGEGGWPDQVRDQGFERYQLEVPISTPLGDIRADALIYRLAPNLILLCEGKSGRNVEEEQANKYESADLSWLARGGVIPPRLRQAGDVAVEPLFVGREEHRADLESGLGAIGVSAPLLTVGSNRVRLSGASATLGLDDFDLTHGGGLPPARFPVDHQSGDQDILELLIPEIVAAQARVEEIVAVESLCERILPEWPVLSNSARADFVRRAAGLLRDLSSGEMRGQVRYEGGLPQIRGGRIVVVDSPAVRDPRGRTQAFQAQQRRAGTALRRAGRPVSEAQLSIDDLAGEGGLADE